MKVKRVAVEITNKAFLPEAYVYEKRFLELGFRCELVYKDEYEVSDYDAVVLFHGFHPFWKKYPKFVIGEYHTLSVGRLSRVKDFLKRIINVRPDFLIFLNEDVRRYIWHQNFTPYALRGMGYNQKNFEGFGQIDKEFDIIYCGSEREGLIPHLERLASLGLCVAVVGFEFTSSFENLKCLGRKSPAEAHKLLSKSRFGLNYTPDVFPFNIQDSTKVIEYCGAGLGVITNRYSWIDEFERTRNARFMSLDAVRHKEDVLKFDFITPDVSDLQWEVVIEKTFCSLQKELS